MSYFTAAIYININYQFYPGIRKSYIIFVGINSGMSRCYFAELSLICIVVIISCWLNSKVGNAAIFIYYTIGRSHKFFGFIQSLLVR